MNLIVTTPKLQIETSNQELDQIKKYGGYFFRTFGYRPKVSVGDRLYEIENGYIVGYGTIIGIDQIDHSLECSTTGKEWGRDGDWVVKYDNWQDLKTKVSMRGIQGIRYTMENYN